MEKNIILSTNKFEKKLHDTIWRVLDIIGAISAISISLPLLVVVALCIKIEDFNAPVIFKQKRVGKNGKYFNMYKFRSMTVDAEHLLAELKEQNEMQGLMFKMKEDPRITRVGKWIRKTSVDEFPQFINILKGEMSFVGPRPPLLNEYAEYNAYHKQRLEVTPGCTGLWQISGRNQLTFEQMVALDLEYIRKRSIFFNIKIILLTFRELSNKGGGM
ncbi:sugar transferase [Candidatus Enterococcus courvalinii]|uniref:Sugar transferase n=1 Tax=Candidatus Enterococcus courvalinii TaxID=2815329 RepID=A0ABS3HX32_9ENTE|nr:sugar transferase [Enterococcus sp. MSG2901]MBO0481019.1 sugar transferase [Enterococcus sp. MSG2901]